MSAPLPTASGLPLSGVTGLVLAAGGSTRLGQPKQLLPVGETTLLGATLTMARRCGFDQLLVTLGGAADEVEAGVDLSGTQVVRNPEFGQGCSSSIAAALPAVDERASGLVLLLGDQPGVDPTTVAGLVGRIAAGATGPASCIAVTRYRDGIGHPFWLGRDLFPQLATLHGDKGVWKLVDAAGSDLVEYPVDHRVPRDVDTWADYQQLLETDGS